MSPRLMTTAALAVPLLLPQALHAQVNLPNVSAADVVRAIRIYRTVRDVGEIATAGGRGSWTSAARARAAVQTGAEYVGVPYVWGGTTPDGFDCSGFVQYVYRKEGVPLPRTSRQMAHAGDAVPARLSSLREGDLMLFRGRNGVIDHVGLYAGRDRMLHSSSSGHGVRFDDLWSERGAYFRSHLVAARRVTGSGPALMAAVERIMREFPFDHYDLPDDAPPPRR